MDLEIAQNQSLAQEEAKGEKDCLLKITSLKNQKQFDLVNQKAKSYISGSLKIVSSILQLGQDSDEKFFLGFKITRKIAKAVTRNKIKRRIKAIIRNAAKCDNGYIKRSQAFILIPRKPILERTYSELENEITIAIKFLNKKLIQN